MPLFDAHVLSFWIRALHVASMAFLLGGALLMWGLADGLQRRELGASGRLLGVAAERYERLFWIAMGVQVVTGIGNLGAFGAALPEQATAWGVKMLIKLSVVLVFMLLSLLRTLLIARLAAAPDGSIAMPLPRIHQVIYGMTAVSLMAVVVLALSLAHG